MSANRLRIASAVQDASLDLWDRFGPFFVPGDDARPSMMFGYLAGQGHPAFAATIAVTIHTQANDNAA